MVSRCVKASGPSVLLARVHALLRRSGMGNTSSDKFSKTLQKIYTFGDFTLDTQLKEMRCADMVVPLTLKE